MNWWDKIVDRMEGHIEDLLKPGTDGLKDHFMAGNKAGLEKAVGV